MNIGGCDAPGRFYEGETPFLLLDVDRILANFEQVRASFGLLRPQVFYAVKANADPRVLLALHRAGCGFDVASLNEINRLDALGVPAAKMIFSATVKLPRHIEAAYALGVERFAFDSPAEVAKLARLAPGSKVVVRLEVPHHGSRWPLGGKFGVPAAEAVDLLRLANASGLRPYGVTFHVGSQCTRSDTWLDAISVCRQVWNAARQEGIHLRLLNLGGGLPARYTEDVPGVSEIGTQVMRRVISAFGRDIEYAIEPGRFLVADAGTIVTTVIGTATRKGKPWVFVDQSVYAGLLEVIGGWTYPMVTRKDDRPKRRVTLAGPSCDSTDILAADAELPELQVGDQILLLTAGAYTTSYQAYNGLSFPEVITVAGQRRAEVGAA
ncbi:MAG: type III PLP-dependent enzyme [Chloroflexota bacterium]